MPWSEKENKWIQPPIILPSNEQERQQTFSPWGLMKPEKKEKPEIKKILVSNAD